MKGLEDWFNNILVVIVGVVVTGLWGFRERVHADRYEKMTLRMSSLEKDVERMEIESSVMAERVSHIAEGQKEIQTDVKMILQTLNTMVGSCSVCDNNTKRIK
jgi:FtsZ-interacting cell division protein ZipA